MVGPKKPNFRYWVEYLGFRLMGAVFSMPVDTASNIAGALMARVGPLSMKRQPRLMRNLTAAFPEMTVAQRDKLAREVWRNIGRVIGEFFHIDAIMRDRIEVADPELLVEAATSGKGAVLCGAASGQLGSGERRLQQLWPETDGGLPADQQSFSWTPK